MILTLASVEAVRNEAQTHEREQEGSQMGLWSGVGGDFRGDHLIAVAAHDELKI